MGAWASNPTLPGYKPCTQSNWPKAQVAGAHDHIVTGLSATTNKHSHCHENIRQISHVSGIQLDKFDDKLNIFQVFKQQNF